MIKVLVVDDEVAVRETLRSILTDKGYEVVTVPSARQALEALFQEAFDALIIEFALPDASGLSVIEKIRQARSRMPVIVFSEGLTAERESSARAAGANEVIAKDLGEKELLSRLEKLIKAQSHINSKSVIRKAKPILVVDDEQDLRFMLKSYLETKGYCVLEAENGRRALEIINKEDVGIVLLDIQMPEMDGLTTLSEIMRIKPNLGVIMVTAVQQDQRVKKAISLGAYSYVLKPFDFLYLDFVILSRLEINNN
ncbi:MAG: response regulator [Candidatus Omnitrophica bacterium]|nr:response regulator [Candidatus Omnitrophota bacterium]